MLRHEPYRLESPNLELECSRLLSIMYGSESLHERIIALDEKSKQFEFLKPAKTLAYFAQHEEIEANRIVLTLAIAIRNGFERQPPLRNGSCGQLRTVKFSRDEFLATESTEYPSALWSELEKNQCADKLLDVREACNKIIHAQGVEWERKRLDGSRPLVSGTDGFYLTGCLWLSGFRPTSQNKREVWVAFLSIEQFVLLTAGEY